MELRIPSPAPADFNFDSACTSPYISAPSSPQHLSNNFFFSAPTSPTYPQFHSGAGSPSTVPFHWEVKPGTPKVKPPANLNHDDHAEFEFDFSGQLEKVSLSADELFHGGKIRPLKPPPRLQLLDLGLHDSPKSPKSPRSRILSPRPRRKEIDPFAAAIEQTRRQSYDRDRGREKMQNPLKSSSRKKGTRSLSPFRVSDILTETVIRNHNTNSSNQTTQSQSQSSSIFSWRRYKNWKLKDLLLFRSASEGRASDKDPLKKYSLISRSSDDVKNLSFRSTESAGSVSSSRRRAAPASVSAHEHYTAKRAAPVTEETKRKTFLPYNTGIILGCLGLNPALHRDISSRFSSTRFSSLNRS